MSVYWLLGYLLRKQSWSLLSLHVYGLSDSNLDTDMVYCHFVIPAQAGIQWHSVDACRFHWTPACAGVTKVNVD